MTWTINYIRAAFRGVAFHVERAPQTGGRKIVEHNLVGRDDSYFQDLGRKSKVFNISAYVIGDDYYSKRDDLIEALEKPGTGILTHPYRGDLEVYCESYTTNEILSEGRMCRFEMTFRWVSDDFLLIPAPSARSNLLDSRDSFLDTLIDTFETVYEIASQPAEVLQDVIDITNKALEIVDSVRKVTSIYDEYQRKLSTLKGKLREFVLQSREIAENLKDVITFGTDPSIPANETIASAEYAKEQYSEMQSLSTFDDESLSSYPSKVEEDGNYPGTLIQKFVSRTALASRVSLISEATIDNTDEADDIIRDLGIQIEKIEDDDYVDVTLKGEARKLRVAVYKRFEERKLLLSTLSTVKYPEFEPVINVSYDVYGNLGKIDEIININNVIHPGFLPGLTDIKINVG